MIRRDAWGEYSRGSLLLLHPMATARNLDSGHTAPTRRDLANNNDHCVPRAGQRRCQPRG